MYSSSSAPRSPLGATAATTTRIPNTMNTAAMTTTTADGNCVAALLSASTPSKQ
jgi:hypothetical protein